MFTVVATTKNKKVALLQVKPKSLKTQQCQSSLLFSLHLLAATMNLFFQCSSCNFQTQVTFVFFLPQICLISKWKWTIPKITNQPPTQWTNSTEQSSSSVSQEILSTLQSPDVDVHVQNKTNPFPQSCDMVTWIFYYSGHTLCTPTSGIGLWIQSDKMKTLF